jgi:hypothetical protein
MSDNQRKEYQNTKTKKVKEKLAVTRTVPVDLETSRKLKEAFVVTIADGKTTNQFTVHRPMGPTVHSPDSWMITNSNEIGQLLARSEQGYPDQAYVSNRRQKLKLFCAVERGFLFQRELDGVCHLFYDRECSHHRKTILDGAKNTLKELNATAEREALAAVQATESPQEKPEGETVKSKRVMKQNARARKVKALAKTEKSYLDLLEEEDFMLEVNLRDYMSSKYMNKVCAELIPHRPYEVRIGDPPNRTQYEVEWLKYTTLQEAKDKFISFVSRATVPVPKDEPLKVPSAPDKDAYEEIEVAEAQCLKFLSDCGTKFYN